MIKFASKVVSLGKNMNQTTLTTRFEAKMVGEFVLTWRENFRSEPRKTRESCSPGFLLKGYYAVFRTVEKGGFGLFSSTPYAPIRSIDF